jgi:hypothetical protein
MLRISTKERLGIFVNYYNHDSILPILLIKRRLSTPPSNTPFDKLQENL